MATRRDPRFKECRRFGLNVYGHPKALKRVKKEQRQKKMSEYGTQLLEKQKLRAYYNLLERQFVRYYDRAKKMEGVTGENMLKLLECRLDNIVYRIGFANSIRQARQMVNHGHILVYLDYNNLCRKQEILWISCFFYSRSGFIDEPLIT